MDYFLSSPTSTSLASSPGIAPTSTILLDHENDQETAITSPNRSRLTKSEQPHETSLSGAHTPQSDATTILQETSDVHYARTFTTNADGTLLDQSPFTTGGATQTRDSELLSATDASSNSSDSPLPVRPPFGDISVSVADVDDTRRVDETVDDISGFRGAPWLPSVVITDDYDDEDSFASFPSTPLSSTDTDTTATTMHARFTAEEKGKAVDRSGREWARSVEEKDEQREGLDEKVPQHKRTKSAGVEDKRLKSALSSKPQSHRRSVSDDGVRYRRRRKVVEEDGLSRDFVLLVALCVGFACAGILIVRPLVLNWGGDGFDLYFDE